MLIDQIIIYPVELPFRADFSHSQRQGSVSRNVVVEIVANGGKLHGFGEGAPREYVTGESQEKALAITRSLIISPGFQWDIPEPSTIWSYIDSLPPDKTTHSALCAVEMAALDALGKELGKGIMSFLPNAFSTDRINYGATLPFSNTERLGKLCAIANSLNIKNLRIKVGRDLSANCNVISYVRQACGSDCDIRLDANGCWDKALALAHIPVIRRCGIRVVEQPLAPGDNDMANIYDPFMTFGVELMADESVCTFDEAVESVKSGFFSSINVRLSKCGGFRKATLLIDYLRSRNFRFQVGCQLGESGILSAAGRALALSCNDAIYYDGSYDTFLLSENLTTEDISFGKEGAAGQILGNGLGIDISRENLTNLASGPAKSVRRP